MASFFGEPPKSTIHQAPGSPGSKPDPGYAFAKMLFNWLPQLLKTPYPTYQGQLDPGLSPTMQDVIKRAQGFAQSSPHEIFAGVQGILGRFMNPQFQNPMTRMFGGAPDYFGVNPNQAVYGCQPASNMAWSLPCENAGGGGQIPQQPAQPQPPPQPTMLWGG